MSLWDYCVVTYTHDGVSQVNTLSSRWLLEDGQHALLPNLPLFDYHQAVREHRYPIADCKMFPVTVLHRTVHFEDARRLESTVGDQRHGTDTDCTIPMQTSPKRVIRLPAKLRDYGDENVPTRKKRCNAPASATYGRFPEFSLEDVARHTMPPQIADDFQEDTHMRGCNEVAVQTEGMKCCKSSGFAL
ncbi:unnamed protein product, partial [Dicrocoelium dendriticum]